MTTPAPLAIVRHYRELSEKDTTAVVQSVADLIVSYLKANPNAGQPASSGPKTRRPRKEAGV